MFICNQDGLGMKLLMISAITLSAFALGAEAGDAPAALPLASLLTAAQTALDTCKTNGYAVTVTVFDADLSTRLVLRADGAPDRTVEVARRKAYTVVKTGMSSGEFGKTVPKPANPAPNTNPSPSTGPPPLPGPVNGDPNLITWAGGLPIRVHGVLMGAMSASGAPGGEKDEACVTAGLARIPGAAQP
jgi:uncharacterized protein GlcG (DUF336 family)